VAALRLTLAKRNATASAKKSHIAMGKKGIDEGFLGYHLSSAS
jgi:hypothetical protein